MVDELDRPRRTLECAGGVGQVDSDLLARVDVAGVANHGARRSCTGVYVGYSGRHLAKRGE